MSNIQNQTAKPSIISKSTRFRLIIVWLIVALFTFGNEYINTDQLNPALAIGVFLVLLASIIGAAFGVVKEADALAHQLGEPFGTLILTLSIVSIEVILIAAVMLGPGDVATIGKDSIFSVMMIIMNLVIGLCILIGGLKFGEQEYNAQGALTYMAMIIMLGGIGMMLPNFIQGAGNGIFTATQSIILSGFIIVLYALFLAFQTKGYSHLYVQPNPGSMEIAFKNRHQFIRPIIVNGNEKSGLKKEILIRTIVLILTILPIVLLSHHMAVVVDYGIAKANLPKQLGGILIAIIVFTPESMTAVKAATNNEFQRVINLCHGAFVSTVGLTVPCVLIIGLIANKTVQFGLSTTEMILFVITLLLSLMSFSGRKTTPFIGIMHLVLFAIFLMLVFNP